MFGAFRGSAARLGGYLWKVSYKMSRTQKAGQRKRLRDVDDVVNKVVQGLGTRRITLNRLVQDFKQKKYIPESNMAPRNKYTVFHQYSRNLRKGAHLQSKFTKVTNRIPPKNLV